MNKAPTPGFTVVLDVVEETVAVPDLAVVARGNKKFASTKRRTRRIRLTVRRMVLELYGDIIT